MATSNDRSRARYGICLSDSCIKCKDKTIQIITGRKDFVCEECGKPLREVPRPLTAWEKHGKKIIGGVVALAIIGGAAAFITLGDNNGKAKSSPVPADSLEADSVKTAPVLPKDTTIVKDDAAKPAPDNTEKESAKSTAAKPEKEKSSHTGSGKAATTATTLQNGYGTVNLGYGKYKGELKNGKPHGHGTITFTSAHKIVASKDFVAQPGDRYEGEFRDGVVSGGIGDWYHDGDITSIKP